MDSITVFLDESGNGNPDQPLVVCGIAVEAGLVGEFEERIRSAYQRVLARPTFRDAEDRERFRRTGFHRSLDLPEVGIEFVHLLSSTSIYKALIIATDRSTLTSDDEVDQLVELYVRLGGVLRRQFRPAPRVDLVIEQNEPLLARMDEIRDRVNSRRNTHGRSLPTVTVTQAAKSPDSVLAAADGLALVASQWLQAGRATDARKFQYRAYVETEAAISWFCSLEHGVLSTRRTRRRALRSSGTGAASVPLAKPHASASEQLLSTRSRAPEPLPPDLMSNLASFAAHLHTEPARLQQVAEEVDQGRCYQVKYVRAGKRTRAVVSPNPHYGTIAKELARLLAGTSSYQAPAHVFGFVRGRSIRDNARAHLDRDCVLRLDLRQFFESIDRGRVIDVLRAQDVAPEVAELVGKLAAPQGHLATGLSTSPHLSNLAFEETDRALVALSDDLGLTFTRYVDDLTFSGAIDEGKADEIRAVLVAHGWRVNERKTRFMRRGHAQYVTGLSVSDRATPHAPRRLKRAMRWRLHIIERYGYDDYMVRFSGSDLGHYPSHLRGVARYLVTQEPGLGAEYLERWEAALPDSWYEDDHATFGYEGSDEAFWR